MLKLYLKYVIINTWEMMHMWSINLFNLYKDVHGTKCLLKKNETYKLAQDRARVVSKTSWVIRKIKFNKEYVSRFSTNSQRERMSEFDGNTRPYFKILRDLHKSLHIQRVTFKNIDMGLAEIKSIVREFYAGLNPKSGLFSQYLPHILDNGIVKIHEEEPSSNVPQSRVFNKNGKIYLALYPLNDVRGLLAVAHEYSHLLSQRNVDNKEQKTDCIKEIESLFIEKIFCDWLVEKGIVQQSQKECLQQECKNNLCEELDYVLRDVDILSRLDGDFSVESFKRLQKGLENDKNKDILLTRLVYMADTKHDSRLSGGYQFRYVVGEIVASALYEDYKENPKEVLQRYEEFLSKNADLALKDSAKMLLGDNYEQKVTNVVDEIKNSQKTNESVELSK